MIQSESARFANLVPWHSLIVQASVRSCKFHLGSFGHRVRNVKMDTKSDARMFLDSARICTLFYGPSKFKNEGRWTLKMPSLCKKECQIVLICLRNLFFKLRQIQSKTSECLLVCSHMVSSIYYWSITTLLHQKRVFFDSFCYIFCRIFQNFSIETNFLTKRKTHVQKIVERWDFVSFLYSEIVLFFK